jgi:uncharacterized protein YydD (DUF2326 family)
MVVPYYEGELRNKKDSTPIDIDLKPVQDVYIASNISPQANFSELDSFVDTYNQRANALTEIKSQLNTLNNELMTAIIPY